MTNLELVRELVRRSSANEVMTMYVDLDPREFSTAPARASALSHAIACARRSAPTPHWGPVLDELRESLAADGVGAARGLLVTATAASDTIRVVRLPRPVPASVCFDDTVHVRPLLDALPRERWCVLLVNRRTARILVGTRDQLAQVAGFEDDVEGQHHTGGWSQSNYERAIDKQADDHLRRACHELEQLLSDGSGFTRLLLAAPEELHGRIEQLLPAGCSERMCGWVHVDIEHTTPTDVLGVAQHIMEEIDLDSQHRIIERVTENVGRRDRGAHGIDEVLRALDQGQVGTLVVAEGLAAGGLCCPTCGWLSTTDLECPVDGAQARWVPDIIERAVESAVRQGAEVVTVGRSAAMPAASRMDAQLRTGDEREEHRLLRRLGSIAAILRFDLDAGAPTQEMG